MQPTTLLALTLLATSALAALDSSIHGAGAVGVHRRHHAKAAARSSKCKSKNKTTTSSSTSSTSTWVAPTTTSTTDAAASTPTDTSSDNSSDGSSNGGSSNVASTPSGEQSGALSDITAFLGDNTGGIGSWFRTDSSSDSTDGTSWCQLKYQDSWMGTAIPVNEMINSFGGDSLAAMKAYCGLEIEATNPANGNVVTMYVVDGFDDAWVLTAASMDLTIAAFTALYGSFDDNKDTVVQNMSWRFTGNKNPAYEYGAST